MLVTTARKAQQRPGFKPAGDAAKRRTTRGVADAHFFAYRRGAKDALLSLRKGTPLAAISRALDGGRAFKVLELFGLTGPKVVADMPQFAGMLRTGHKIFEESALMNLELAPDQFRRRGILKRDLAESELELGFRFDIFNTTSVAFIQQSDFQLVRGLDAKTTAGLRRILAASFTEGIPPAASARLIRDTVGLTAKQMDMVSNFRAALSGNKLGGPLRAALRRQLRDRRFDASLIRAIERGQVLLAAQQEKMVARFASRLLDFRANNIARTETIRAANAGTQALWRQMTNAGILIRDEVRRFWIVTRDDRLCPICAPIPGMNPEGVGIDQPFQTPVGEIMFAPAHSQCRCDQALDTVTP